MNFINEAFKKLEMLNEEEFSLTKDGLQDLAKFRDGDDLDVITVIDSEAETEDDLQDSYIGKVILDCEVCHSKIYKDPSEVTIDNELNIANNEEECPYCYSQEGFKVVGQVCDFNPNAKVEKENPETEVKVDGKDVDQKDDEEETNESLEEGYGDDAGYYGGQRGRGIWKDTVPDWARKQGITASEWERRKSSNADYNRDLTKYGTGSRRWNESKETNAPINENDDKGYYNHNYGNSTIGNAVSPRKSYLSTEKEPLTAKQKWLKDRGIKYEELEEKLDESFENVSIDTGNEVIKVTTEPKQDSGNAEAIAPVDPSVEAQFGSTSDDSGETGEDEAIAAALASEDEIDAEIDEIVEESFNYLSESYLKKVYGNVESYRTVKASQNGNKLIFEGIIKFNSGKEKVTSFVFEAFKATKTGKVKFIGENQQITKGKRAFNLYGKLSDKKLIAESLNYNYRAKNSDNKSTKVYGTVKFK
jgi:hypothetical protein